MPVGVEQGALSIGRQGWPLARRAMGVRQISQGLAFDAKHVVDVGDVRVAGELGGHGLLGFVGSG